MLSPCSRSTKLPLYLLRWILHSPSITKVVHSSDAGGFEAAVEALGVDPARLARSLVDTKALYETLLR